MDNRIATNRNTKCIEEDLRVEHLTLSGDSHEIRTRKGYLYWIGLLGIVVVGLTTAYQLALPIHLPESALSETLTGTFTTSRNILRATIFVCSLAAMFRVKRRGKKHISYIPHLVTCALSEYSRGTNVEVVQSTLR